MRKYKFLIAILMVFILTITSVDVYALTETTHFYSSAAVAGSFYDEPIHPVTSSTLASRKHYLFHLK